MCNWDCAGPRLGRTIWAAFRAMRSHQAKSAVPDLPYISAYIRPTSAAPPMKFPMVAGMRLWRMNWEAVMGAPSTMAMGMVNMLAMQCSYASATKAEMGRKMPMNCRKAAGRWRLC